MCSDIDDCLNQLTWNNKLAVAVSHERIQDNLLLRKSHIYCFDKSQSIHGYFTRFLIGEHFPYLQQLNDFIEKASSSGLISHWIKMNRMKTYFYEQKFIIPHIVILGVWVIFSSLSCFSIFVYFAERIIYKKNREANVKNFWIIAEMLIDPDRHFLLHDLSH